MKTDQKFSSFQALNGRDGVEFVDCGPEKPISRNDQDFINGVCIYTNTLEAWQKRRGTFCQRLGVSDLGAEIEALTFSQELDNHGNRMVQENCSPSGKDNCRRPWQCI